jgi:hypothetical protein
MGHLSEVLPPQNTKIYLSPLHIKLGLIKISVKAMDKESKTSAYLRQKFPKLTKARMKEGIFFGPQLNNYSKTKNLIQN